MTVTPRWWLFPACLAAGMCLSACSRMAPSGPVARGCTGVCLSGRDPYDTGCASGAMTVGQAEARDATGQLVAKVELRRSLRCETSWARAVRVPGATGALVATVSAAGSSSSFEHATDGEVWTDMIPSAHACVAATGGVRQRDGAGLDASATTCAGAGAVALASK